MICQANHVHAQVSSLTALLATLVPGASAGVTENSVFDISHSQIFCVDTV